MKKFAFLLLIAIAFLSCTTDKQAIIQETKDKVQNMKDTELVTELLVKTEGDNEQLGRILNCSVFTLNRIENNETHLTDNARKEFVNLLFDFESNRMETLKERDPYYDSWARSLRNTLNIWIWVMFISMVISLALAIFFNAVIIFLFFMELIVVGVVYLTTWIANMLSPYENPAFLFIEKINPFFEIVF